MEKFVPRTSFFHKELLIAGIKLPFFDPRLGALSGVPFREVYKIYRSTPYGRL